MVSYYDACTIGASVGIVALNAIRIGGAKVCMTSSDAAPIHPFKLSLYGKKPAENGEHVDISKRTRADAKLFGLILLIILSS